MDRAQSNSCRQRSGKVRGTGAESTKRLARQTGAHFRIRIEWRESRSGLEYKDVVVAENGVAGKDGCGQGQRPGEGFARQLVALGGK